MFDTAQERAAAYRVLSLCFHPPDEPLLEALRETDVPGLCPSTLPALDELQRDYARLFVGPFGVPAPPYGSVYMENEGRVCGESTADVLARYRQEGLRIALKEPADHVALELEYMYLLVFRQMEAEAAGEEDTAARYIEKQRVFLQTHLGAWAPMLKDRIVENAQTEFYVHVGTITDSLVGRDLEMRRAAHNRAGTMGPSATR